MKYAATMTFLHKFCSLWSFGVYYLPSSMVDYTEREERLREKRKNVCFPITSPPPAHHRERRTIKRNFNNNNNNNNI